MLFSLGPSPWFHLLSPFYWHCHRHSMKAADWMRRWVRVRRVWYCLLCVCFLPSFVGVQRRRWASDDRPQPSVLGGHEYSPPPPPHALPEPASPLLGLVFCVDLSPTYCTYALFGLCVLERPIGEVWPVCFSPVFKVTPSDAFTVATVRLLRLNWHSCLRCITLIWRRKHNISNPSNPTRLDVWERFHHT